MTTFGTQADDIIRRLSTIDHTSPVIDKPRVELAIKEHFQRLGIPPVPVRWVDDAVGGFSAAWSAARSAARSAATKRWIGIWLPFVDAAEAGLWLFWVLETHVLATPRPALKVVGGQLHSDDGAAVSWPNGTRFWFLHGVQVPKELV